MDKTQIITVIVSAITGAIAKPFIEWLISIIKTAEIVKTISAVVKMAFSKTNRAVIFDLASLTFYVAVLVSFARDKSSPTKLDILITIGASLACVIMAVSLFVHIVLAIKANKKH